MQYPKPPPKPDEVRAGQRKLDAKRDFFEDRAAADYYGMQQSTAESFAMRSRERRDPGYIDRRARILDNDTEKRLQFRERAHAGLLKKSIEYWGDGEKAAPTPTAPSPTAPTGGVSGGTQAAPKPQAAPQAVGDAAGALADVPWRKRRVAPQGMTRAAQAGELSRLLGI